VYSIRKLKELPRPTKRAVEPIIIEIIKKIHGNDHLWNLLKLIILVSLINLGQSPTSLLTLDVVATANRLASITPFNRDFCSFLAFHLRTVRLILDQNF
jgi:hypothetical protein